MINLSPDIVLWIVGALFSQLTISIHLLIQILRGLTDVKTEQALQKQRLQYIESEKG